LGRQRSPDSSRRRSWGQLRAHGRWRVAAPDSEIVRSECGCSLGSSSSGRPECRFRAFGGHGEPAPPRGKRPGWLGLPMGSLPLASAQAGAGQMAWCVARPATPRHLSAPVPDPAAQALPVTTLAAAGAAAAHPRALRVSDTSGRNPRLRQRPPRPPGSCRRPPLAAGRVRPPRYAICTGCSRLPTHPKATTGPTRGSACSSRRSATAITAAGVCSKRQRGHATKQRRLGC
jgi:hypothetical protein